MSFSALILLASAVRMPNISKHFIVSVLGATAVQCCLLFDVFSENQHGRLIFVQLSPQDLICFSKGVRHFLIFDNLGLSTFMDLPTS